MERKALDRMVGVRKNHWLDRWSSAPDLGHGLCDCSTSFGGGDAWRMLSHLQQLVEQDEGVLALGAISSDAAIMAALTIRSSGMTS
ncbi:MAG: hypothetical protein RI906_845 [Pseudomonadota bacterium]